MKTKRVVSILLVMAMLLGLIPSDGSLSLTAKASEGELIQINSGHSLGTMTRGAQIFLDRDFAFLDYPAAFDGMSYVRSNLSDVVNITTLESTWIYVITPSHSNGDSEAVNLVSNLGFKLVDIAPWSLYVTSNSAAYQTVSVYERFVSRNETIKIPRWGIVIPSKTQLDLTTNLITVPDDQMAVMESTSGKPVYNAMYNQNLLFNDRIFTIVQLPYFMAGKNYIATNLTKGEDSIVATRAGYLYCMTATNDSGTSQVSSLQNQGFEVVYTTNEFKIHGSDDNNTKTVLRKYVNIGDKVQINRYVIPFFSGEFEVSAEMAVLEPTNADTKIVKFLPGQNISSDLNTSAFKDNIPQGLVGKSFLYADNSTGGYAEVTKGGTLYAYAEIGSGDTAIAARERLTNAGFKKSLYRPISLMDFDSGMYQLYEKEVSVGDKVELGSWIFVVFDSVEENQYYDVPSCTYVPDVIWNPGAEYDAITRNWQGIASIEKTGDRIWAAWYTGGKWEPDPDNYSVLAYSDDDGATWVDPAVVITNAHPEVVTGDPQFWTDPNGTLWIIFMQRGDRYNGTCCAWYITCDNPEAETPTFSEPKLMTSEGIVRNRPIVLENGEWLVSVMNFTDNGGNNTPILSSVDNGKTWKVKSVVNVNHSLFDEAMLIERQDGVLWYLSRSNGVELKESFSYDGGVTWTTGVLSGIKNPGSRFFIRRLESGNLLLINHYNFTNRSHLTALLSTDEGETWPYTLVLDEREQVSYPDAIQTSDGTIYAIHDRERQDAKEIIMHVFTEEDVIAGSFQSEVARQKVLISKVGWDGAQVSDDLEKINLSDKLVWATTTSNVGNSAHAAFDGKDDTCWVASDNSFPQTLTIDLGEVKDIANINIKFDEKSNWEYTLNISETGKNWSQYAANPTEIPFEQEYSCENVARARYVAIHITSGGTNVNGEPCKASIKEMSVFDANSTNLALNKPCKATTIADGGVSARSAFDNDLKTKYCALDNTMPQQLMVDLEENYDIGAVYIGFERESSWNYMLETSDDGVSWETYVNPTEQVLRDVTETKDTTARYVRLTVEGATGEQSVSLCEMEVYTYAEKTKITGVGILDQNPNKGIHTFDDGSRLIQVTFNKDFWTHNAGSAYKGETQYYVELQDCVNTKLLINGKRPSQWVGNLGDDSWGCVLAHVKKNDTLGQYLEIDFIEKPGVTGLPTEDTDCTITFLKGFAGVLKEDVTFTYTANNNVPYKENDVFEMTKGGSIRLAEPYGLRFQVKMSSDVKENIINNNGKVGMLIFPADYLVNDGTNGDVYYESVEALAESSNANHRIDLNLTNKLYEEDGYWCGNGVIANIKEKNMAREFVGIAYCEVNGEKIWADVSEIANTTRSAAQVALMTHTHDTSLSSKESQLLVKYIEYLKTADVEDNEPNHYMVRGYAASDGLRFHVEQYVNSLVEVGDRVKEQTHLEVQIWQDNMGYGVDAGFSTETYGYFWLDGTSELSSVTNIKNVINEVTIFDRGLDFTDGYRYRISYDIFIEFEKNMGRFKEPYACVQFKHHMPNESEGSFTNSYRECKDDNRYLWQDSCLSYEFNRAGIVGKRE